MAKPVVISKKPKNKPETLLVQTNIGKKLAHLIDQVAEEKEMSRAEYLRELLEHCGREIMSGNLK